MKYLPIAGAFGLTQIFKKMTSGKIRATRHSLGCLWLKVWLLSSRPSFHGEAVESNMADRPRFLDVKCSLASEWPHQIKQFLIDQNMG